MLIGRALCRQFDLDETQVLDIYALSSAARISRTRLTHDNSSIQEGLEFYRLSRSKARYADKEVVLLVRNVKDTVVSCYFQATKRLAEPFSGSISEFVRSDRFGARKIIEFYNIWHRERDTPRRFLRVTYEGLHASPDAEVERILRFLGVQSPDATAIREAVEFGSFGNMRKLERARALGVGAMMPGRSGDAESYKVRKGKVNGYRAYRSDDDVAYIDGLVETLGCRFEPSPR